MAIAYVPSSNNKGCATYNLTCNNLLLGVLFICSYVMEKIFAHMKAIAESRMNENIFTMLIKMRNARLIAPRHKR